MRKDPICTAQIPVMAARWGEFLQTGRRRRECEISPPPTDERLHCTDCMPRNAKVKHCNYKVGASYSRLVRFVRRCCLFVRRGVLRQRGLRRGRARNRPVNKVSRRCLVSVNITLADSNPIGIPSLWLFNSGTLEALLYNRWMVVSPSSFVLPLEKRERGKGPSANFLGA